MMSNQERVVPAVVVRRMLNLLGVAWDIAAANVVVLDHLVIVTTKVQITLSELIHTCFKLRPKSHMVY